MNCSTPESSAVLVVDHTAKLSGVGFGNHLLPGVSDLTEKSLEQLLIEIRDAACTLGGPVCIMPTHVIVRLARPVRRVRGTRMALVSRLDIVENLIPARSIRGWMFYADYAYVDRRRVKRSLRRHYKESRNVPVRNHGAGHQRVRA